MGKKKRKGEREWERRGTEKLLGELLRIREEVGKELINLRTTRRLFHLQVKSHGVSQEIKGVDRIINLGM